MAYLRFDELRSLARQVRQVFGLIWKLRPLLALTIVGLAVLSGVLPVVLSVTTALAVAAGARVLDVGFDSSAGSDLTTATWVFLGVFAFNGMVNSSTGLIGSHLRRAIDGALRATVMELAVAPRSIEHLDREELRDTIRQVNNAGSAAGQMAALLPNVIGARIGSLCYVVVLTWVAWPVGLVFALLWLPTQSEMLKAVYRIMLGSGFWVPADVSYTLELGTDVASANEVRVFGLGNWLRSRYLVSMRACMEAAWKTRREFTSSLIVMLVVTAAASVYAITYLATSDAELATFALAMGCLVALSPRLVLDDIFLRQATGVVDAVEQASEASRVAVAAWTGASSAVGMPFSRVRFENVWFRYPGSDVDVLRGVTFDLNVGERVALVGINGVGKTTLVKLLAGFYQPTSGRVLVDEVPLDQLSMESWQRQLGVVFQDFARYTLSVRDNVRFGAASWDLDEDVEREVLASVAERAGILDLVDSTTLGWDTPLGVGSQDSRDLSGGQWQRVALARSLYALRSGSTVFVLDEPTANLDVRAESEFYERFVELIEESGRKLVTLLISHRFSTVRRAERIIVLVDGRVAEVGSHAELLSLEGQYAQMFHAQARHFVSQSASEEL